MTKRNQWKNTVCRQAFDTEAERDAALQEAIKNERPRFIDGPDGTIILNPNRPKRKLAYNSK